MNKALFANWQSVVPELSRVLSEMRSKKTIALSINPYVRIIPTAFLEKDYEMYCSKYSKDVDVVRRVTDVYTLEEKHPKAAKKVRSMSYLLGNYGFQGFLKSRRYPFRLMFTQITPPIEEKLKQLKYEYIGNKEEVYSEFLTKGAFRSILKKLGIPYLPDWYVSREDFVNLSFKDVYDKWGSGVVVQRADREVGGQDGTFFVSTEDEFKQTQTFLVQEEETERVLISPKIEGMSISMLGCVTHLGVITGALQSQLIDIPESLAERKPRGVFIGHDWSLGGWGPETELQAEEIVKKVGEYLATKGYKGIFGVDFMYSSDGKLYPLECNPRPTGALPVYSLMTLHRGEVPPLEFFHMMAQMGIEAMFDPEYISMLLKKTLPVAHLGISPEDARTVPDSILPGVYSFDDEGYRYERPGLFLADIEGDNEFLLLDSVPRPERKVPLGTIRIFKLIFNQGIAETSHRVRPEIGALVSRIIGDLKKVEVEPGDDDFEGNSEEY